jgi:SnoaL-like polyketide cyclase
MSRVAAAAGRKMHFTGTTVLRLENGKIVEEVGLDDGVTALTQLALIRTVKSHWKKFTGEGQTASRLF